MGRTRKHRRTKASSSPVQPSSPLLTLPSINLPPWGWYLVIFVLAASVRLIVLYQLRDYPYVARLSMDPQYNWEWASRLAQGDPLPAEPFFRAPLYIYVLAFFLRITGGHIMSVRVLQAFLGSLTPVLAMWLGTRLWNFKLGRIAGLILAFYGPLVYFDIQLLIPVILTPLHLTALALLLLFATPARPMSLALPGFALGLSAIARPNILLCVPVFALGWWIQSGRNNTAFVGAAVLCVVCGLVIMPVTLYNWWVGDDLVLIASQGGVNFFIGNNPDSDGCTAIVPGTRGSWWGGYRDTHSIAETAMGRTLKSSEVSKYWYGQARQFWRHHPWQALRLLGWKAYIFWLGTEIPNNDDLYAAANHASLLGVLMIPGRISFPFGILGPLALMGLVLCWHDLRRLWPLYVYTSVYYISLIIFFVNARFRIPMIPVLVLIACAGVGHLWLLWHARPRRGVAATIGLCGLIWICNLVGPTPRMEANRLVREASHLYSLRRYQEALVRYRQAQRQHPQLALPREGVATSLAALGRFHEMETELRAALDEVGSTPELHAHLGKALARQKKFDEAFEEFHRALDLNPQFEDAHHEYGIALVDAGQLAEGILQLQESVRLAPEKSHQWINLAQAYIDARDFETAEEALQQAQSLDPYSPHIESKRRQIRQTQATFSE